MLIGGSGFIGRNLKEFLEKKEDSYEIFAPASGKLDVSDEQAVKEMLEKQYYDVIIHAGVQSKSRCYKRSIKGIG